MDRFLHSQISKWFFWSLFFAGVVIYLGFEFPSLWSFTQLRNLSSEAKPVPATVDNFNGSDAIEVRVESVGGIPDNGEQELTLKGTVILHRLIDGEVEYHWTLPPEAQLVDGEIDDSWSDLPLNRPTEVKITITGVSKQNPSSIVLFRAQNTIDGLPIGSSAIFTPQPKFVHF